MATKPNGRIIAIVGAQSSGKSTLASRLAESLPDAFAFYEGEEFPPYVFDSFENLQPRIQAFLFFHNQWLEQYLEADKIRSGGGTAVLDAFWLTNLFYLDTLENPIERNLMQELIHATSKMVKPPEGVVYLEIGKDDMISRIQSRAKSGNRPWEENESWYNEALNVLRRHEKFFSQPDQIATYLGKPEMYRIDATDPDLVDKVAGFIQSVDVK